MSDDTLIADLVRAGVSADLVGRVANAMRDAAVAASLSRPWGRHAASHPLMRRTTFVYGLIDPVDDSMFYVGVAYNPDERFKQHRTVEEGSTYGRIQAIINIGEEPQLRILREFEDRNEALKHELHLIRTLPNLINKQHHPSRTLGLVLQ